MTATTRTSGRAAAGPRSGAGARELLWRVADSGVVIPALFLTTLLAVYAMRSPGALEPAQLRFTLFNASLALVLAAAGLGLVVLVGGLDLSSAGVISAVNAMLTVHYGGSVTHQAGWLALVVVGGALFGAFNGLVVHRFGLESVVVTLASGFMLTGAALLLLPEPAGLPLIEGTSLVALATGEVAGLPVSLLVALAVCAGWILLRRSRMGTWMVSVGSDRDAAAYTGVPVGLTRVTAFAAAGALYALAGIAVTSQTSGGDAQLGAGYLLGSFAAVVIGGVRLGGGSGSLIGVVLGAMALTVSVNVLFALDIESYWSTIVRGLLLLLAIGAQAALALWLTRLRRGAPPATVASPKEGLS